MVQKEIRWGICNSSNRYAKPNNKYIKEYDKINNGHILNLGM